MLANTVVDIKFNGYLFLSSTWNCVKGDVQQYCWLQDVLLSGLFIS